MGRIRRAIERQVRERGERGEGGDSMGGEEHDNDDVNIAAVAIVTAALNSTINQR